MPKKLEIIGAGMAGLSCAMELVRRGHQVALFDKGRGPGGRMATRRAEIGEETFRFDHGAQYFTARDPRFARAVAEWQVTGVVAPWPAASEEALVGIPGMNAPIRHMAEALDVSWGTRIERLSRDGSRWLLHAQGKTFAADHVICAIPAEQAAELLAQPAPEFAARAAAIRSAPCWAVMAKFAEPLDLLDCFKGEDIGWAARNGAKPGREGQETWVIHGSSQWSAKHLEMAAQDLGPMLLAAFFAETGAMPLVPEHLSAHRWRYAMVGKAAGPPALWDADLGVGACGDWLVGPRVESAWVSGFELAQLVAG